MLNRWFGMKTSISGYLDMSKQDKRLIAFLYFYVNCYYYTYFMCDYYGGFLVL